MATWPSRRHTSAPVPGAHADIQPHGSGRIPISKNSLSRMIAGTAGPLHGIDCRSALGFQNGQKLDMSAFDIAGRPKEICSQAWFARGRRLGSDAEADRTNPPATPSPRRQGERLHSSSTSITVDTRRCNGQHPPTSTRPHPPQRTITLQAQLAKLSDTAPATTGGASSAVLKAPHAPPRRACRQPAGVGAWSMPSKPVGRT